MYVQEGKPKVLSLKRRTPRGGSRGRKRERANGERKRWKIVEGAGGAVEVSIDSDSAS